MALLSSEKIIEYLPNLFETNVDGEVNIFKKIEKFLVFDEGFIYYANPDSLQFKFGYKKHDDYLPESVFNLPPKEKEFVFSKEGKVLNVSENQPEIIKQIGLDKFNFGSYLIAKLSIKSTVYGIIVLAKKDQLRAYRC